MLILLFLYLLSEERLPSTQGHAQDIVPTWWLCYYLIALFDHGHVQYRYFTCKIVLSIWIRIDTISFQLHSMNEKYWFASRAQLSQTMHPTLILLEYCLAIQCLFFMIIIVYLSVCRNCLREQQMRCLSLSSRLTGETQ